MRINAAIRSDITQRKTMTNVIEILKTELASNQYQSLVVAQNYQAIANQLNNRPLIANTATQQTVPLIPSIENVYAAITPEEALTLYQIPGLVDGIKQAITLASLPDLQIYFAIASTKLSTQSQINVQALLAKTQLDPNYQSQVPGQSRADQLGIYPVNSAQVQAALN